MNRNCSFDLDNEEIVSALDEINLWSAPFAIKLLDLIKYKKSINALDIGFGTGFPLIELAMRLGPTSAVFGIDPWQSGASRAMSKILTHGIQNTTIIEGVAGQLPFGDNFLDLIVSNNGINNVDNMVEVFRECYRVSKPGAQLVFSVNLQYTMSQFYEVFKKALISNGLGSLVADIDRHIYSKRKPVKEILELIDNAGFAVKNIYHDKFNFRYTDGTAFLNHYFIRLAFMPEWVKIVPEDKTELIFSFIESELNLIAGNSDGLSLTIPFAVFDCTKPDNYLT